MNERIRELTIKALVLSVPAKLTTLSSSINNGDGVDIPLEFAEKFAELIVRECLTFVEPMPGSGDIDDLALEAARDGIKEHFGVEE